MTKDTNTASGAADLPEARLFTKKPVTISATQWFKNGDHPQVRAIAPSDDLFFTGMGGAMLTGREKYGVIGTLESPNHLVTPGDWIITGVAGEHYACKPDIFEATYSPAALAAGQATAAQAVVQDDLITLRKPTTSAELLWLLKLAHLVISDVDKTLEETFAPAQPAAEASRFGSPELQAMIIARCVEKDQADSVPAVSDLPPLPAPDLRDVGTKPQEIKEFLKGYATEYARTAIAARAPADSVQEDAARLDWLLLRVSGAEFRHE